ncbi:lysozyme inhibitor LprI family protein, partial [Clostridium sp.]|uniref:lysozyme inhibitor LprI family protein n=1 Tax=Clostridium sp. TaxID=1506 RepID=UPI001A4D5AB9
MRPKIKCVLLVFLLGISITACSSNKSNLNQNNSSTASSNKTSDTSVPISPSSNPINAPSDSKSESNKNDLVLESYKTVLQNKVNFFSVDDNNKIYLNDILKKQYPGNIFKVTRFTVIDMDGDKIPEVVLELSNANNNPMFFEILHYMKGVVYGYNIVYRGLEQLKTDGTAWSSSGASDNVCGKLKFESNAYQTDIFGYNKSSQNNDGITTAYFINNKPVTKEAFDSFSKEQNVKKDVAWFEFSQKNIATELSINSYSEKVKEESDKQEYKTKLDNVEIGLNYLKEKEAGTTMDMREAADEKYKKWDTALNE